MKKDLVVGGMHCASCEVLLKDVISEIPGAKVDKIDFKSGKISLDYDSDATLNKIARAIAAEGYKV